jgi:hypothetical protein
VEVRRSVWLLVPLVTVPSVELHPMAAMACGLQPLLHGPFSSPPRAFPSRSSSLPLGSRILLLVPRGSRYLRLAPPRALPDVAGAAAGLRDVLADAFLAYPPTWSSAAATNLAVFVAGSPLLLSGLSASGFAAAYALGTLTWRAFGSRGYLLAAAYFIVVSGFGAALPVVDSH